MKKRLFSIFSGMAILSLVLFFSCEIGLGSSVDTEAPKVEFDSSTVKAGSVVRDAFAVCGTFEDDGSIGSVKATLTNLENRSSKKKSGSIDASGGKWKVSFDPTAENLADGKYELTVELKDTAGHKTKVSRTLIIDNTAPLVILTRPGTKTGDGTFDSYGQKFTLEGKAADDNDVSLIQVQVYDNEACSGDPIKTIELPNVPLTIETDVAEYAENEANDYAVIYGHVDANGFALKDGVTAKRYCKLVVYDGAQRFPEDGSAQSEEDKKGNQTSSYYINDDEISKILTEYKITELYHILNNSYTPSGSRTITVDSVKTKLEQQVVPGSQFTINPENSPTFVVNSRSPFRSGANLDEAEYILMSGSNKIQVEISAGLDKYKIRDKTVGIYLKECDKYGVVPDSAPKIWLVKPCEPKDPEHPEEPGPDFYKNTNHGSSEVEIVQAGTTYKFTTANNISPSSYPALSAPGYYKVFVVGCDVWGNAILSRTDSDTNEKEVYAFLLKPDTKMINLAVTDVKPEWLSWETTDAAYKKYTAKVTFSGGDASTYTVTRNGVSLGTKASPFTDTYTISSSDHPTQMKYKVTGNNGAASTEFVVNSYHYDNDPPELPAADIVYPTEEDTEEPSFQFSGNASDADSGVSKIMLKISDTEGSKTTGEIPIIWTDTHWEKNIKKADYAKANQDNGVFATEGLKKVEIYAVDNVGLKSDTVTKIDWLFDTADPVVTPNGISSVTGNLFTLSGTASDNYGIEKVEIKQQKLKSDGSADGSPITVAVTGTNSWTSWTTGNLPYKNSTTAYTATEIGGDTHPADGKYKYTIIATDKAEKTSDPVEVTITLNTQASGFVTDTNFDDWFATKRITVSGTASAVSPVTIKKVYAWISKTQQTPAASDYPATDVDKESSWTGNGKHWKVAGSSNWVVNLTSSDVDDSDSNLLYFATVDSLNRIEKIGPYTLKVDSSAPSLKPLFYKIPDTTIYKKADGTIYVNGKTNGTVAGVAHNYDLVVYGEYNDNVSGVEDLTFTLKDAELSPKEIKYSTQSISGEVTSDKVKGLTYGTTLSNSTARTVTYWRATFNSTDFTSSNVGDLKVSGGNKALSGVETKVFTIEFDNTPAEFENVKFKSDVAQYSVYESGSDYYVNKDQTFTVSGNASDAGGGVADVKLIIGTDTAHPKSIDPTSKLSSWVFSGVNLSGQTGTSVKLTLEVTDVAGNKDSKEYNFKFDQTSPLAMHWADSSNKDVYFRIGNADNDKHPTQSGKNEAGDSWSDTLDKDVGKKYSFGSYGNDSTIEIRGTFKEEGSGLKKIYYKIYKGTAPTASEITSIKNGTLPSGVKEFAPLTNPEKRRVPYNTPSSGKKSVEIESNFREKLAGFDGTNNYLVLIAEDNVGNRRLDELKVTRTKNSSGIIGAEITNESSFVSSSWNSAGHNTETSYLNLNKDTTVPNIETDPEFKQGVFTNGFTDVTITGTASDADAGLAKVTISIDEKYTVSGTEYTVKYNDEISAPLTNDKWSFTIPASTFPKELSGKSITAYITAIDAAGEGNKKQANANILIDTTAPTVTVNSPKDADTSTTDVDVNGTIQLSGNADDDYGIESVLGIYYTSADTATSFNGATVWNKNIAYKVNDKVYYATDKKFYSCKTAHTSGETFDSTKWNAINWTKLADTTALTDPDAKTAWTYENIVTSILDGTTTIADGTKLWLTVAVLDKAGNIGYGLLDPKAQTPKALQINVDQNTDRPVVQFTNLTKEGGKYILKFGTNSQMEGKLSDDDSSGSAVVDTFVISSSPVTTAPTNASGDWTMTENGNEITWSHKVEIGKDTSNNPIYRNEITKYNKTTGDYTFTPAVTDDGAKELYFFVKDNDGKSFYTTAAATATSGISQHLNNPKEQYKQEAATDNIAKLEYKSDGTAPSITDVQIEVYKDDTPEDDTLSPGTGTVVGGTKRNKIKFIITASDANGIKDMSLTYTPDGATSGTTISTGTEFTATNNSTPAVWTTNFIPVSSISTGSVNVAITVNDQSGLSANSSPVFMVDNDGPAITITSPKSTDETTGSLTISGTSVDEGNAGAASIDFLIPTKTQRTSVAAATDGYASLDENVWGGKWDSGSTVSNFKYVFDGDTTNANPLLDRYTKDEPDDNKVYDFEKNEFDIYTVTVVFRSKDSLGNVSYEEFNVTYNPDGDKPKTEISYPSSANYQKDEDGNSLGYVTLGGEIRVTGSVLIPSGTSTPDKIYLQIADENGNFTSTDKTKAQNTYGYAVKTITNAGTQSEPVYKIDGTTVSGIKGTAATNWWGIEANLSSFTWSIKLNSDGKMNPASDSDTTNNIWIRACGVNAEGKMGAWSDPVCIHIDANAPKYTHKLYQFENDTPAFDANANPKNVIAERDYTPGIYLKGQWYLGLEITDEDSIVINSVKKGNDNATYISKPVNVTGGKKMGLLITLDPNSDSTQTYTVSAEDVPENGNSHPINPSYEINIDNVAPTIDPIKSDSGYPISMTKQRTSNNTITFASSSEDAGSGFNRLAYYFKRGSQIELPLPEQVDSANNKWQVGDSSAFTSSSLTAKTIDDNTGAQLYGVTLGGTKGTDATMGYTTFTLTNAIGSNTFIRPGAITKMAGTFYVIDKVDGKKITIRGTIGTDFDEAFFPAAIIVDNANETPSWSSGVNTIKNDDGDGITETVSKSGNTWNWDTSIYAGELEDGEVTLVCVAFDVAENARSLSTNFMLTNKTPRVNKLYLATDLNGDGKYSDFELGKSVISGSNGTESVENYYSALSGGVQEVFNVFGEEIDPNDPTNLKNSTTKSGITMRDKLGIALEFVGNGSKEGFGAGHGTLKYKYSVAANPLETDETKAGYGPEAGIIGALSSTSSPFNDSGSGLQYFEIGTTAIKNNTYGTYTEYKAPGETGYDANANYLNYIRVTIWDSSKNGSGTPDTGKESKSIIDNKGNTIGYDVYTSFGDQWTAFNIPLYMDLVDGVKPTVEIDDPVAVTHTTGTGDDEVVVADGHVDLKASLSALTGTLEFDKDDKVSGKFKFTGTINDDKRVSYINLGVTKKFSDVTVNGTRLATYSTTTGGFKVGTTTTDVVPGTTTIVPASATGLTFKILTSEFSTINGHTVTWELEVDSELVERLAQTDVVFTVTATDGTSTTDATHQVDIVPYIASLDRPDAKTDTHRSRRGKYQVVLGEDVTIKGFNLPATTASAIKLQNAANAKKASTTFTSEITAKNGSTKNSMTFTVPGNSGYIKVITNGVSSVNNFNGDTDNNKAESEYSGDEWYDDVYLNVWKNDEYFYFSNDPISPSMDRIANGNGQYRLYGGWGTQGSRFYASYPYTSAASSGTSGASSYKPSGSGNAPSPANGGNTEGLSSQNFGDPATFYDVVISGTTKYNVLIDCWQGNTNQWGRNFVINKNGRYSFIACTNRDTALQGSSGHRYVVERMGGAQHPDDANATSADGLDEMFNQFLNPRITVSSTGEAYITYYDRYAKCLKWAMTGDYGTGTQPDRKYATEGVWEGGSYSNATGTAVTANGNGTLTKYYTNGGMVVAGYDTTQDDGTKSNLDVGKWSDIAVESTTNGGTGKPVIAYYDTTNKRLMVATSASATYPVNTNTPVVTGTATSATEGNAWNRQTAGTANLRLGEYVSLALDGGNNIHIACKGAKDGALYYVYGARTAYGSYTWTTVCVDNNGNPGTWTDIKLTTPTASGAAAGPIISYYDPTNDDTEDALKVAYYEAPAGTVTNPHLNPSNWDTMTVPCNSAATANRITLALDVTDGINYSTTGTTNNSKLAVGYVSSRFDCVYLRKE